MRGLSCPPAWELGANCLMSWPLPAFTPWISKQVKGIVGIKEKGGERRGYFPGPEVDGKLPEEAERQGDWKPAWGIGSSAGAALWRGPFPGCEGRVASTLGGVCLALDDPSSLTHSLSTEEAPGSHVCTLGPLVTADCPSMDLGPQLNQSWFFLCNLDLD